MILGQNATCHFVFSQGQPDVQSHEIDYEIFGDDMQIVEIELAPNETVVAEAGAMNYMEDGIDDEAKMGDGSVLGGLGNLFGD